jgi:hypothetical protein
LALSGVWRVGEKAGGVLRGSRGSKARGLVGSIRRNGAGRVGGIQRRLVLWNRTDNLVGVSSGMEGRAPSGIHN